MTLASEMSGEGSGQRGFGRILDRRGRRRASPGAIAMHSRRVRYLRLAVPAVAAGLMLTYGLSASPPRVDADFVRQFQQLDVADAHLRLDRPRHVGYDLEGRAFEVSAQTASRDPNAPDLVSLENPEAFRELDTAAQARVRASTGVMDTQANTLDLTRDVRIDYDLGGAPIVITTNQAAVDFDTNTVTASAGISGAGERGTVAADNLTAYQEEGRLVLEGKVRLRLQPSDAGELR